MILTLIKEEDEGVKNHVKRGPESSNKFTKIEKNAKFFVKHTDFG